MKSGQCLSGVKADIKADISRPHIQLRMSDRQASRNAQIPLGEFRQQILIAAAERNMHYITAQKSIAWGRPMQTYLPRCLARKHVQG